MNIYKNNIVEECIESISQLQGVNNFQCQYFTDSKFFFFFYASWAPVREATCKQRKSCLLITSRHGTLRSISLSLTLENNLFMLSQVELVMRKLFVSTTTTKRNMFIRQHC